ncbi:MAG: restriction endonuclease subunit S [Candidatus Obscuribacter sp.]|nr:restriction endonuclease subunit S [Candidatus Obscuribacter sp.]MBK9278553.1 restriction endonuclease subunit S [Candidatus Obscuribacter sp.]
MKSLALEHLPVIASAPSGVKKLRELILQLAVMGKLVPQDPNDEPASKLLKRLKAHKQKLLNDGLVRKEKLDEDTSIGLSLECLPRSWGHARVGDILAVSRGASPRPKGDPRYFSTVRTPYHWVKISDLRKHGSGGLLLDTDEFLTEEGSKHSVLAAKGTLVITNSATVGVPIQMGIDGYIHDGFLSFPFFPLRDLDKQFFLLALQALTPHLLGEARGLAQLNMNSGIMRRAVIPLPPLAEQHRIVAKVDELMALCDKLEAQQNGSEAAHSLLLKTLLDTLTQSQDADDFAASWARIKENFHTLFTTEESVDILKQTLLQLAVMGAFDSNRSDWTFEKASSLCTKVQSGKTPKEGFTDTPGVPFLKVYNIVRQELDFEYRPQFIPTALHKGQMNNSCVFPGDVLMNIVGPPLGKVAIVPNTYPEWNINQALTAFRPSARCTSKWLYLCLCSGLTIRGIYTRGTAGQDNISLTQCREMIISLPPLAEQHRIVAKVDELMDLCDKLKADIKASVRLQEHVSSVMLQAAVGGESEPASDSRKQGVLSRA